MTLNELIGALIAYLGEQTIPDTSKLHWWLKQARLRVYNFILRNNPQALRRETDINVGEGQRDLPLPSFSKALEAYIQYATDDAETWYHLAIKPYLDTHATFNPGLTGRPRHLLIAPSGNGILWPVPDTNYRLRYVYAAPLDDFIWELPNGDWYIPEEYLDLFLKELAYAYAVAYPRDYGARIPLIKQDIQETQETLKRVWNTYGGEKHIRRIVRYPRRFR
ncbi:MAG: hypothetical protein ABIN54_09090 [candidate division WOR-3 bacterium]